jgi:chemotaxis protein methyltransferase CheR
MAIGLSEQQLLELSAFVGDHIGLHFPKERWRELAAGIDAAARSCELPDAGSLAHRLLSAPPTQEQIDILARDLTIGETYFFRERRSLAIVAEQILPKLISARRGNVQRLRIWSAGCCTGEEPYSIAILLDRLLPDLRDWQITILGTDINSRFLHRAAEGVFGEWSFRDVPPWLKQGYFQPVGKARLAIAPRIKELVSFAYLNLGKDVYPSLANDTNAMDLIFCRNVLMYFVPERARKVVGNLHRSLLNGGWLVVSAVETSAELFSQFVAVPFEGATLYRKESDAPSMQGPAVCTDAPDIRWIGAALPPSPPPPPLCAPAPAQLDSAAVEASLTQSTSTARDELYKADDETTRHEAALALFKRGNYLAAAAKLDAKDLPAPLRVDSSVLLARIYANLGELGQARQWAERALAADKISAGVHYLLALILQEQGAMQAAVAALRRALYVEPDFVLAHFALGTLLRRQERQKEADRHLANALQLLQRYQDDDVLPDSDGLAVNRLRAMIRSMLAEEIDA